MKPQLTASGQLYGRDKELSALKEAYRAAAVEDGQPQRVLLGGVSGSGKSALVQAAFGKQQDNQTNKWLFGRGKFEQTASSYQPYQSLAQCLSEVCRQILTGKSHVHKYRERFRETLDSEEIDLLTSLVPEIADLYSSSSGAQEQRSHTTIRSRPSKESLEQLKFAIRLLVEAMSSCGLVLVLFLDDLQWVDTASLDLLKTILSNSDARKLVFIGSYRSEEVELIKEEIESDDEEKEETKKEKAEDKKEDPHKLALWIHEMEKETDRTYGLTNLNIENLTIAALESLLSQLLRVDESSETLTELARILHNRTGGNAFHIWQLVDFLQSKQILQYNTVSYRWTWDLVQLKTRTSIRLDSVALVVTKLQGLSDEERTGLKVCACLGPRLNRNHWDTVAPAVLKLEEGAISTILDRLVEYGLLEWVTEFRLKFVHDQIYQASLDLFEMEEKAPMHLQLADLLQHLTRNDNGEQNDEEFFLCVDQWNFGRPAMESDHQSNISLSKIDLAKLNLQAGQRAAELSAFVPSADYLSTGLLHVSWETDYALTLELTSILAEVGFCGGLVKTRDGAVQQVIDRARKDNDRIRAYLVRMRTFAGDAKQEELLETSRTLLQILGHPLPDKPAKAPSCRNPARIELAMAWS